MILDDFNDRFAIVAHRGNSAHFKPNSRAAFVSALESGADLIQTDVQRCANGVLFCTGDTLVAGRLVGAMGREALQDAGVVPLYELMALAKRANKGLLLTPQSTHSSLTQRIAGDARFFNMHDRVAVVAHSLKHTKDIRAQSAALGIVGILRQPEHYAAFFKAGGNVSTLRQYTTTPANVRLAEAAQGRHRHPFWVLANDAGIRDVFNAHDGLIGASGMVMKDPAVGREALRRVGAFSPAFARSCPD